MKLGLTTILLLFLTVFTLQAQDNQYRSAKDSDPQAVKLLENLRTKYDAFATLRADFQLDIAFPGQPIESQKGQISRRGDNVRFKLGEQEGIINKEAAYIIQHGNKEVMINNLPEPGELSGVLTPQTLFSFYEGDKYVLAITGSETVGGRTAKVIELKPVDRNASEFSKMRLLVDATKNEIVSIKAFAADGSRYAFTLNNTEANPVLPASTFKFVQSEFPGYHVEDLRY
ncbi:LolA family protein [Neolewinella antarctica]|uniref:Outer membrane lipoprotein-sorting protein n=1 Tax=Neolewinella antarctica TaxID=442734 RepID=A0ABX0XBP1_9BACT|nr:outer membrane lipoprotein carrier protein LolA [Neolewinella antarctica]NJC26680.1 outer membrane lipoprotein-sorting protein [Neolewinella antarctica]